MSKEKGLSMEEAYMQDHPEINEAYLHATNIGETPEDKKNPLKIYAGQKKAAIKDWLLKGASSSRDWLKRREIELVSGEKVPVGEKIDDIMAKYEGAICEVVNNTKKEANDLRESYKRGKSHIAGHAVVFGLRLAEWGCKKQLDILSDVFDEVKETYRGGGAFDKIKRGVEFASRVREIAKEAKFTSQASQVISGLFVDDKEANPQPMEAVKRLANVLTQG